MFENSEDLEKVFSFFEDISSIPRCSGNEKAISDNIYRFAVDRDLSAVQDEHFNLVIKKAGYSGYENAPPIAIQGHIDMVCDKNRDTVHDFSKDPLQLYIDGDFIKAKGTTLGADNGIAVAYAMALLDSDNIPHPPLEIILTADEEDGMGGAGTLLPELITAKTLINIDSEEEGVFLTGCAGGIKCLIEIEDELFAAPDDYSPVSVRVSGLQGGHSGMDIDKELGNSNKIIGRVLYTVSRKFDIFLRDISGGLKDNAIPRESEAIVYVKNNELDDFVNEIGDLEKTIKHEFIFSDAGLKISAERTVLTDRRVFSEEMSGKIISALILIPNGPLNMSAAIQGLVETSNNLGIVRTDFGRIFFTNAVRSSVVSRKYNVVGQLNSLAELLGGRFSVYNEYPAWEYNPDSKIRELFVETYREMYSKEPVVTAIHAGLECGIFAEKMKGIDLISFGPNIYGAHTPDEKLSISSVRNVWEFLLNVLKKLR